MSRADSAVRRTRHRQALISWVAIYPTITLASWIYQSLPLVALPLAVRTLILTVVIVPTMVYILIPAINGLLVLRTDHRPSTTASPASSPPGTPSKAGRVFVSRSSSLRLPPR